MFLFCPAPSWLFDPLTPKSLTLASHLLLPVAFLTLTHPKLLVYDQKAIGLKQLFQIISTQATMATTIGMLTLLILSPVSLPTSSSPVIRPWLLGGRPNQPHQRYVYQIRHVHHVRQPWRPTTSSPRSTTLDTMMDRLPSAVESGQEPRSDETIGEFEMKLILPILFLVFTLWILTVLVVLWR